MILIATGSFTACGGDDDSGPPEPDTTADAGGILDPSLSAQQVIDLVSDQCNGARPTEMTGLGYTAFQGCPQGTTLFQVFESSTAVDVFLTGRSCESGVYYARGPLWIAAGVDVGVISQMIDAGATSLSCNGN